MPPGVLLARCRQSTVSSDRDECEITDAVNLFLQSGRTIDAIRMDGWRIDVGYPEDRDEAERRLRAERGADVEAESD